MKSSRIIWNFSRRQIHGNELSKQKYFLEFKLLDSDRKIEQLENEINDLEDLNKKLTMENVNLKSKMSKTHPYNFFAYGCIAGWYSFLVVSIFMH